MRNNYLLFCLIISQTHNIPTTKKQIIVYRRNIVQKSTNNNIHKLKQQLSQTHINGLDFKKKKCHNKNVKNKDSHTYTERRRWLSRGQSRVVFATTL